MAKTPTEQARIARMAKLIQGCRVEYEKIGEYLEELDDLAGGGAGIGPKVKHLEQQFDRLWCHLYAGGQTGRYIWVYTRDRGPMKKLIRTLGVDEVNRRMENYMRSSDDFTVHARHSFPVFVATINSQTDRPTLADLDLDAGAFGCQHTPRCANDVEHTKRKLRSWG